MKHFMKKEIQDKILSIEKKISNNTEKKNRLLDGYLNGLIEKKDFVIKKKEIEDAYQNLVFQLEDLKSQSTPSTCEIKERIKKCNIYKQPSKLYICIKVKVSYL